MEKVVSFILKVIGNETFIDEPVVDCDKIFLQETPCLLVKIKHEL